jgi:hypothetical protein
MPRIGIGQLGQWSLFVSPLQLCDCDTSLGDVHPCHRENGRWTKASSPSESREEWFFLTI